MTRNEKIALAVLAGGVVAVVVLSRKSAQAASLPAPLPTPEKTVADAPAPTTEIVAPRPRQRPAPAPRTTFEAPAPSAAVRTPLQLASDLAGIELPSLARRVREVLTVQLGALGIPAMPDVLPEIRATSWLSSHGSVPPSNPSALLLWSATKINTLARSRFYAA